MKRIDGITLLDMMKNKEIKNGTKIYMTFKNECLNNNRYKFYTIYGRYIQLHVWREEKNKEDEEIRYLDTEDLLNKDFYILEENKEIEELKTEYKTTFIETEIIDKINELARAVNKLIEESEEK